MIWRTEKFCGRWIHLCSASIAVSVAASVHTFILSFFVFFMSIYSFRPIKRQFYLQALVSLLWRWRWLVRPTWELTPSSPLSDNLAENHDTHVKLLHTVCQYFPRVCRSGCGTACVIRGSVTDESGQLVSAELAQQTSTAPPWWAGHPRVAGVLQSPSIVRESAGLSGGLHERR